MDTTVTVNMAKNSIYKNAMNTTFLKIASSLFCMTTLLSCLEENSGGKKIAVSETTLNVEATANSRTSFEIQPYEQWTVVPSVDWLNVALARGENDNTIVTLIAEENDNMDVRTAEIVVTAPGVTPVTISLAQKCAPLHPIDYKALCGNLPKKDSAILFAAGLISFPNTRERVVAIAPDGTELFFTRLGNQGPRIYRSVYRDRKWQEAELASFSVNNIATEPFISPDGNKLFFVSARAESPSPDIWMSVKENNIWGSPTRLGETINTSGEEWHPSVSANGDLYFASTKAGGSGNADLYFSKYVNGAFTANHNLGNVLNTAYNEWDPYISPDGKYMIFKSDRPGGLGGMDMYISLKKNGKWTTPQNLGAPINTAIDDDAGDVTPDGKYLIFARESIGVMDVYWIRTDALKKFIQN